MIRLLHLVCGRLFEKVAQILVTLTSHCDFHFKHLNISFSENKLIVYLNSSCQDCSIQKNRKKLHGFSQPDTIEFLIDERKLSMIKLDYILFHLSTAFNSKKLFNALPDEMASTVNNFAT